MEPFRSPRGGVELTPELLSAQGRSLRALARSLLRDPHAAEDVVQETWLVCLRHPGAIRGKFSAWIATVARNLARRRQRSEVRRRSRESRVAVHEGVQGASQAALLREEALRAVTQALLALEEPYKSALLLRFYEERTPIEIAHELGLPPTTVKSRIARGLEQLRVQLAAEHGEDGRWLQGLLLLSGRELTLLGTGVGAGTVAGPVASGIGALLMGLKLECAGAALLLACGMYFLWPGASDGRVTPVGAGTGDGSTAAGPSALAAAATAGPLPTALPGQSNRAPVPEAAAASEVGTAFVAPETGFPYRIAGLVRDVRDQPLPGARVYLAPHGFPLNRVAVTDDFGRFSVEFRGRRPALELVLSIEAGGDGYLGLRELHAVSGRELRLDLGLRAEPQRASAFLSFRTTALYAGGLAPVEQEGEQELELAPGDEAEAPSSEESSGPLVVDFEPAILSPLERAPELERAGDGGGVFVDRPLDRCCEREVLETRMEELVRRFGSAWPPGDEYLEGGRYEIVLSGGFDFAGAPHEDEQPRVVVHGVVRDALGNPVAGAGVGWGLGARPLTILCSTDESGAFELTDLPADTEVVLRAGGGDLGLARERFTLRADEELAWNPLLERGDEVSGRLFGPDGKPLAGTLVELWSAGPSSVWNDSTLTNEDGRFAIPNVPGGPFDLLVVPQGRLFDLPVRRVPGVRAGEELGAIVLSAEELATGSLSVALHDDRGEPVIGPEARVWQVETGRGLFAHGPDDEGRLELGALPVGRFRVEIGCELGWRDLGTVWIGAGEELDLGAERFEPAGAVALELPPGRETGAKLELWSEHPDVLGRVFSLDEPGTTRRPLRSGRYLASASSPRGRARAQLEISPGSLRDLALVEEDGTLELREGQTTEPLALPVQEASCLRCHATSGEALQGGD